MQENIVTKNLLTMADRLKSERKTEPVILNRIKEELQFYILDFIYNHRNYSHLIMYGGSLLRIVYDLPRMSEDLDFQTARAIDLAVFKTDLGEHFSKRYDLQVDVAINNRPDEPTKLLKIRFNILDQFNFKSISWTKLLIRLDINLFEKADEFMTKVQSVVHGNLSFSIKTYPLSTLMASKVLAVLKRTSRGIGQEIGECKPRDVYDLLWYLDKRVVPDIQYLEKNGFLGNILEVFDDLRLRVANLKDNLFEADLAQFFYDRTSYDTWFRNWRQRFLTLIDAYSIYEVGEFEGIRFSVDFDTRVGLIHYYFHASNKDEELHFVVRLSDHWYDSDAVIKPGNRAEEIERHIETELEKKLSAADYEYIGLFYRKIQDYIKRSKGVLLRKDFTTKLIRVTADNLDSKDQIVLNKRLLLKVRFEELL